VILIKEDTKKMADLLRSGNTMLNLACPICNNPIFKNKSGELFCPVCNREVIIVENKHDQNIENTNNQRINKIKDKTSPQENGNSLSITVQEVINKKIEWIINKLKNETKIEIINTYLKLLLNCYDILRKAKNHN
jgi:uncharacterized Zn finger protein (UPF0148 family)